MSRLKDLKRNIDFLQKQPYLDPSHLQRAINEYNDYYISHPKLARGQMKKIIDFVINQYQYREDITAADVFQRTGYPADMETDFTPNITKRLSELAKVGVLVRMSKGVYQKVF